MEKEESARGGYKLTSIKALHLLRSCRQGNLPEVQRILSCPQRQQQDNDDGENNAVVVAVDPNECDFEGTTPLQIAFQSNRMDIAACLVKAGARNTFNIPQNVLDDAYPSSTTANDSVESDGYDGASPQAAASEDGATAVNENELATNDDGEAVSGNATKSLAQAQTEECRLELLNQKATTAALEECNDDDDGTATVATIISALSKSRASNNYISCRVRQKKPIQTRAELEHEKTWLEVMVRRGMSETATLKDTKVASKAKQVLETIEKLLESDNYPTLCELQATWQLVSRSISRLSLGEKRTNLKRAQEDIERKINEEILASRRISKQWPPGTTTTGMNDLDQTYCTVFMSHTGRDVGARNFAAYLTDFLRRSHRIDVFLDADSLESSKPWGTSIRHHARHCAVFVCVLSPSYFDRFWCLEELRLAMTSSSSSQNSRVIPVWYGMSRPPKVNESLRAKLAKVLKRSVAEMGRRGSKKSTTHIIDQWCDCIRALDKCQGIKPNHTQEYKLSEIRFRDDVVDAILKEIQSFNKT